MSSAAPVPDLGPVPEDNQSGHHPAREQDQPDLDAMAARLGAVPPDERDERDEPEADRGPAERALTAAAGLAAVPVGLARAGLWSAGYVVGIAPRAVARRLGVSA